MKTTSLFSSLRRPAPPPGALLPRMAPALLALTLMAGAVATAETIDNGVKEIAGVTEILNEGLWLGVSGEGTLRISEGGSLIDANLTGYDLILGYYESANGSALVTGTDSFLKNNGYLYLGYFGEGHLTIEEGGTVVTGKTATLGYEADGWGEVLVTGSGSIWSVTSQITVGRLGDGQLTISDGGLVETAQVRIGNGSTEASEVTVTGGNSRFETTGNFHVGYESEGRLNVTEGGVVDVGSLRLGSNVGYGKMVIDGTGSTVESKTPMFLANSGRADVLIQNGGKLVSEDGWVARNDGSIAFVMVTGAGSRWENSGYIEIGESGWARLTIADGGVVTSEDFANTAGEEGSYGEIIITGAGSAWLADVNLQIGYRGEGKLTVNDGGKVSILGQAGLIRVGLEEGGHGTINLGGEADDAARQAGILEAVEIRGGDGTGVVQFNHTAARDDPYYFTRDGTATGTALKITGNLSLLHTAGTTVLSGANTFTQGAILNGGTVITSGTGALGKGRLELNANGVLNPLTALSITGAFAWNGGTIEQSLGTTATTIQIGGLLTNTTGEFSLSTGAGFAVNTAYTLLSWTEGNADGFDWSTLGINTLDGFPLLTPTLLEAGNTLQVVYLGNSTGTVLQNTGPYFTPIDANFLVQEGVETGTDTESNRVDALTFSLDGTLTVHNTLTLTSGVVSVESGSNSVLLGGLIQSDGDFTFHTDGDLLVTSRLEGGEWDNLIKFGEGTLTLLGVNTYGGNTAINEGVLAVAADESLGLGGDIELNGGTLRLLGSFATDRSAWLWSEGGAIAVDAAQTVVWNGLISNVVPGTGSFTKRGLGTLELTRENPFSSSTAIDEGTLRTRHEQALGTGPVTLNPGAILNPVGKLALSHLIWNGDALIALGSEDQPGGWLEIGRFEKGTDGDFTFDLGYSGILPNTEYTVLTFEELLDFTLEDFSANELYGITPIFTLTGDRLVIRYAGGAITGPVLQNSGPYWTPQDALFTVAGRVSTGSLTEDNTIRGLLFKSGSSLAVHNTLTVTDGGFTVPEGQASLTGERIATPGDFHKDGGGALIVDAWQLHVGGGARVSDGGLVLNGHFKATGGLHIGQNGWLGGSGVVAAHVINSGTLSPGNSPGTLTVASDYTQTAGGIFELEIESASSFDQLIVHGRATLAGTLEVIPYPGVSYGDTFSFLHADQIHGAFDRINLPSGLRGRFLIGGDGGSGSLLLAPVSYTELAQTPNQRETAKALDGFINAAKGDRATVSIALDHLRAEEYASAFNQISPAFYQTLPNLTIEQSHAQGQMLQQRFGAIGLGSRGFTQSGIDAPMVAAGSGEGGKEVHDIMIPSAENRWAVWLQGNGLFSRRNSIHHLPNYRFDSGGFLLGGDYAWSEQFATGLYAGYQGLRARYDDASRTEIDAARFGGYALYQAGNGFYANGVVGGGFSSYTASRKLDFGSIKRTARSEPDGGEFSAMLGGGYDWKPGNFTLGPIASAQYTYVHVGSFKEEGAKSLNLHLDRQETHSLRSTLGVRAAYTWRLSGGACLIPEARVTWQHEFLQGSRTLHAALDGGNGPALSQSTATPSRDALYAGAGLNVQFNPSWSANLYYNIDYGRGDFRSQMVSGGVNIRF